MSNENLTVNVIASNPRPTTCDYRGGYDVDVTVSIGGCVLPAGEVTLAPAQDGRPCYEAIAPYADGWVSGALLASLSSLEGEAFHDALRTIASEADTAIQEVQS